jgi:hypothetical protein
MARYLVFAIMTALLQGSPAGVWLETLQRPAVPDRDFTEVGLAVFDLSVNARGVVADQDPLYGQPPFIEPARVSFDEWQFRQGSNDVHVNATFLFKPRLELPDSDSVLNIPPPDAQDQLASPFPVTVVNPGYPMNGMSGGAVTMQAAILPDGTVADIRVIHEATVLTAAAVAALREWRFLVPTDLQPDSRTAVVTIYFQEPELHKAAPNAAATSPPAVIVSATSSTAPVGAAGNIEVGDPMGMNFVYADSNWVVPHALISTIEYAGDAHTQSHLTITFTGARNEEKVIFSLSEVDALATASVLSARTGKPIEFRSITVGAVCEGVN